VGRLMGIGYSLFFDDGKCVIIHKAFEKRAGEIKMTKNNMFPFETKGNDESKKVLAAINQSNSKV
jgi:hypothetical protein